MPILTITTTDYDIAPEHGYTMAIIAITVLILFVLLLYVFLIKDDGIDEKDKV
jgi:hypothetical protein